MQLLQSPKLLLEDFTQTLMQILLKMKQGLVSQRQLHLLQEQSHVWFKNTIINC